MSSASAFPSLVCAVIVAVVLSPVAAQGIDRVDTERPGTYLIQRAGQRPAPETPEGRVNTVQPGAQTAAATDIPAVIGTSFGVFYAVRGGGAPGTVVPLTAITRFPPNGLTNPDTGRRFTQSRYETTGTVGEPVFRSYTFDHAWELVPGEWVFEFWSEGRKVGEQRFMVYVPMM